MARVFKYPLSVGGICTLQLPKGAQVLHADVQASMPHLWALVNPEAETEGRNFVIAGTGHEIGTTNLRHISTFFVENGKFVFHVFELTCASGWQNAWLPVRSPGYSLC